MNRRERRATGQVSKRSGADDPASLFETAHRHKRAGRFLEAQLCCQQALLADANHADSLHLMGCLSLRNEQHDHAIEWFARAIKVEGKADYLSSLSQALIKAGRTDEAFRVLEKAIALRPADAELWKNLGALLIDLGRSDEALLTLRHAQSLRSPYVEAANLSGLILYRQGRFAEALQAFDISVRTNANQAWALHMRSLMFEKLGRLEEAVADGTRSLQLDPANADMHHNLGYTFHRLDRFQDALECFDRALALVPAHVATLINKAVLLIDLLRLDEALACYAQLEQIRPGDPLTTWNISNIDLMTGNFEEGWAKRESHWKTGLGMALPGFVQPQWLGDASIDGKTILLFAEEGIGDSLQFARYVPMVADLGARIVLAVAPPARPLLARLPGVIECISNRDIVSSVELPAFDVYCAMSSLPLAFKTRLDSIPSPAPYLPAPMPARKNEWEQRLGPRDKLRVGLVWSGNPGHANDRNRSIPLKMMAGLLDLDARFVSLQKDLKDSDRELLSQLDILDETGRLSDFDETAALVACLDLIISVDTSVAHLAGGYGCAVWTLLPYRPDYRWLLDRDDSPWYPTMRLFRQSEMRDYGSVMQRVRTALGGMIRGSERS